MTKRFLATAVITSVFAATVGTAAFAQTPLSSAFTYQGQLNLSGGLVNDTADFVFALWDAPNGGTLIGPVVEVPGVSVVDGLFTVQLDFGVIAFNGDARWLEVDVASPAGGDFTRLSPRQPLTAVPYSLQTRGIYVNTAGNVGIGTTSPGAKLGVVGDIRVSGKVQSSMGNLELSGGGSGVTVNLDEDGNSSDAFVISDTGVERFRVDGSTGTVTAPAFAGDGSGLNDVPGTWNENGTDVYFNGNVGIGTTTPAAKLHIRRSLRLSSDAFSPIMEFVNEDDGDSFDITYARGADRLGIQSNKQDVMVIEKDGDVGIGTSTPTAKLDVVGTIHANAFSGDGSALTNIPGDNLGDHTATQALDMNSFDINNAGTVTASAFSGDGSGLTNISGAAATTCDIRLANGFIVRTRAVLLDQVQTSGQLFQNTTSAWQSFTAGTSGDLASVAVLRNTTGREGVIELYEGQGTGGTLLSSIAVPRVSTEQWQVADFPTAVPVIAGSQYTIRVVGAGNIKWHLSDQNPYPGGIGTGAADRDYAFGTYLLDPSSNFEHSLVVDSLTGNVGIGRNATTNALEVEGNASKSTAGNWLANSDRRIKQNIKTIKGALDALDKVHLVSFEYTDNYCATHPNVGSGRYLNVIAQEFAQVFPDWVKGSGEYLPDGTEILQVDTYPLTIYSAAATQELHKQLIARDKDITGLRKANADLESANAGLVARMARLEFLVAELTNK